MFNNIILTFFPSMGDYNKSKKSKQLKEQKSFVMWCLTHSGTSLPHGHWGQLMGAEGHMLECSLPSCWSLPPSNSITHTHISVRDSSCNLLWFKCHFLFIYPSCFYFPVYFSLPPPFTRKRDQVGHKQFFCVACELMPVLHSFTWII